MINVSQVLPKQLRTTSEFPKKLVIEEFSKVLMTEKVLNWHGNTSSQQSVKYSVR